MGTGLVSLGYHFFSKLRGPGFKSWARTVGGPIIITMWCAPTRLRVNKGPFLSFSFNTSMLDCYFNYSKL